MRAYVCLLVAVLVSIVASSAQATLATYDVDFSGAASPSGDQLRVFGTITLDPDLSVGAAVQSSALQFQHNSEPLISLPSIPNYIANVSTALDWVVDGDSLYITRLTFDNARVEWPVYSPVLAQISFGAGGNRHILGYNDFVDPYESVNLKSIGGADGPLGFLVGTAVAVPEPSAFLCVGLLGLGLVGWKKMRHKA